MNDEAKNFAKNLKILMEYHGDTQTTLSNKSGVSQKTISNMLNPGDSNSPNLANVTLVAKAYKLQTWHLLFPNAQADILSLSCWPHLLPFHIYYISLSSGYIN